MLPCQHTFCRNCIEKQLLALNLLKKTRTPPVVKKAPLTCCLCQKSYVLEEGMGSLEKLPKNLHVESLLKLMEEEKSPKTPKAVDYKCVKCNMISQQEEHVCQHCMQVNTCNNYCQFSSLLSVFILCLFGNFLSSKISKNSQNLK